MKKPIAIVIAIVLLVLGIGLGAWSADSLLSEVHERCLRSRSAAVQYLDQAIAAKGTPKAAELMEKGRSESQWADIECPRASELRQTGLYTGLGGVALIIASIVLLGISRKRTA